MRQLSQAGIQLILRFSSLSLKESKNDEVFLELLFYLYCIELMNMLYYDMLYFLAKMLYTAPVWRMKNHNWKRGNLKYVKMCLHRLQNGWTVTPVRSVSSLSSGTSNRCGTVRKSAYDRYCTPPFLMFFYLLHFYMKCSMTINQT